MSAYLVSPEHIGLIAAYARAMLDRGEAVDLAELLAQANVNSVAARYPNDKSGERPGQIEGQSDDDFIAESRQWAERYDANPPTVSHARMCRYIECLEYQCCEVHDWDECVAKHLLDAAREHASLHRESEDVDGVWDFYDEGEAT